MGPDKHEKTCDDTLKEYRDTIYLQSHSQPSVKSYRTAIVGSKNGFRVFLQKKYNCDELQLSHKIKNKRTCCLDESNKLIFNYFFILFSFIIDYFFILKFVVLI